ncbi:Cytochrome P, partial [Trema orientale]
CKYTVMVSLYDMCKNPLVQEKVAQEARDVVCCIEDEANIDDFVPNLTDAILEKMQYLPAALTLQRLITLQFLW